MRRSLRRSGYALLALGALFGADAGGCSNGHSYLASTGSGGESAGSASTSNGAGGTAGSGGSGGAGIITGGEGAGPVGPSRLTLLNGVADYEAVRFCFMPYPPDGSHPEPWPAETDGLAFAEARLVDPIASAIPKGTDVLPYVIGGKLAKTVGKDCETLIAQGTPAQPSAAAAGGGGPGGAGGGGGSGGEGGVPPVPSPFGPFVARPLAVLPSSQIYAGRSVLVVAAGCLGGEGHEGGSSALACGSTHTNATPSAALVAFAMSRYATPGRVGLQVAHASRGLALSDFSVKQASEDASALPLAAGLAFGARAPVTPFALLASGDVGDLDDAKIRVHADLDPTPLAARSFRDALAHGGADPVELVDGSDYTLVAVGAAPGLSPGFWRPFTFTAVRSDP